MSERKHYDIQKILYHKTDKDMKTFVALGFFDGVHLGHQLLIHDCIKKADQDQAISTVILLEPHPEKVVRPLKDFLLLTTLEERIQRIKQLGIGQIVIIHFEKRFQRINAEYFVTDILLKQFNMGAVFVGNNYHFGYQKRGDAKLLEKLGQLHHFKTYVLDLKRMNGNQEISSTVIKEELRRGNIEKANKLLGYHYQISGEVIHGDHRGNRVLSLPTANILFSKDKLIPKNGVYLAFAEIEEKRYRGLLSIGYNPTFMEKDCSLSVEMNLFDFKGDLYGKKMSISLIQRIRDEIKFPNSESLILQIKKDKVIARKLFEQVNSLL
ncbi:MAG: bifunctional riboflavin kinase/FAD synthetase [Candidatus Atribacteria bacterium]|nr:bifunctional riboflavin kinase/FAD synthetase [Candidatus Atribacteria bacterium]